jgi:hypothetical protein
MVDWRFDWPQGACGLALLAMVASPSAVLAEQPSPSKPSHSYFSVEAENDIFGNGADHDFTHGTAVNYFSGRCQFQWVARAARAIGLAPREASDCRGTRVGLGFGQAIYTPTDISREVPDPHDRPYAGWLYASLGLVSEQVSPSGEIPGDDTVDRALKKVELSLGVVGPAAGAGVVQTNYHKLIGAAQPRGWSHQLADEPALLLSFEYQRRFGRRFGDFLEADLTPSAGVSLGNVFTEGSLGLTVRIGRDMLSDYGPPRIRPSLPGGAFFERPESGIGWYVFAGIEGRAVARNIFLDGNSYVSGPHVEKQNFVGDAQLGIAITLGSMRLSYTNIFRTREFSGQPKPDDFGAISASFQL